jgi:hypothetical protein
VERSPPLIESILQGGCPAPRKQQRWRIESSSGSGMRCRSERSRNQRFVNKEHELGWFISTCDLGITGLVDYNG